MTRSILFLIFIVSCSVGADIDVTVESILKDAEQGDADAQSLMGFIYSKGEGGVREDDVEAVKWYRMAAEQGSADAQCSLGAMYILGDGVPEDDVLSYMWLNLSAATGHEKANKLKISIARRMSAEQIAEAQKLSREWKPSGKR